MEKNKIKIIEATFIDIEISKLVKGNKYTISTREPVFDLNMYERVYINSKTMEYNLSLEELKFVGISANGKTLTFHRSVN